LLLVRREYPGLKVGAVQRLIAGYLRNPAKIEELAERLGSFRVACHIEQLKRAGLYEEVFQSDPFDPDSEVAVKLTRADAEFFRSQPSEEEVRAHIQRRLGIT
jgi:hypothetical protein